jgi:CRISPR-associated endonuclease/helicase Cas3
MKTTWNAHSGDNSDPQTYRDHITNVYGGAVSRAQSTLKHSKLSRIERDFFVDIVAIAALVHDLGKLDDSSQVILSATTPLKDAKMLNHVDAGVAWCLGQYAQTKNLAYLFAAYLVHAHHIGLQNYHELIEIRPAGMLAGSVFRALEDFRDSSNVTIKYNLVGDISVRKYIDERLPLYWSRHCESINVQYTPKSNCTKFYPLRPFDLRMALSCLVDADHTDTSTFYSAGVCQTFYAPLDAAIYLERLISHQKTLPVNCTKERLALRKLLFDIGTGIDADTSHFHLMEAPVGTGKTFAELAACLEIAAKKNCVKHFTILPYILTINQTYERYVEALLLQDQEKQMINRVHSKMEFEDVMLRKYSQTFQYPINITTAVLFFESLASNRPSGIRKLHHFANAVFNLDEFHTMCPHNLWDYNLVLLENLSRYNSHFLFGSGSAVHYWELFNKKLNVNSVIDANDSQKFFAAEEKRLVKLPVPKQFTELNEFYRFVLKKKSPSTLIVCNTIKNALVIADELKKRSKKIVYHLSTALNNTDKERVLAKIKKDLKAGKKIIVVATSIIECGIDISFRTGFRELCGLLDYMQFNGRINRECEHGKKSKSYVMEFIGPLKDRLDGILTDNPQLAGRQRVYRHLSEDEFHPQFCSNAVDQELEAARAPMDFVKMERDGEFAAIRDHYKVIDNNMAVIITDDEIVEKMKRNENISPAEISQYTVQVWMGRLEKFVASGLVTRLSDVLSSIVIETGDNRWFAPEGDRDYYVWDNDRCPYDPEFYGIGRGILGM